MIIKTRKIVVDPVTKEEIGYMKDDGTFEYYKKEEPLITSENSIQRKINYARRWILTFLVLSPLFFTFFTPWKVLYSRNPTIYSFWNYSPIFSKWENKNTSYDLRIIDTTRIAMWEVIIGTICMIGYVYQSKK